MRAESTARASRPLDSVGETASETKWGEIGVGRFDVENR